MSDDANDFLMRGGTPSAKFPAIGSTVVGLITKPPKRAEVTDPATKEVKRWPNGDPKIQIIVDLQTELRESDDDGGERTLWIKGQMMQAVRDAVRATGAKGLEVGGVLQVTWSEEKRTTLQPQKIYVSRYWPPQAAPVEVPGTPWEQEAAPASPPQTPWQQAEQRAVQARPVSTPPAPAQPAAQEPPSSFLERLRATSENQKAHTEARGRSAQGRFQDVEPPF